MCCLKARRRWFKIYSYKLCSSPWCQTTADLLEYPIIPGLAVVHSYNSSATEHIYVNRVIRGDRDKDSDGPRELPRRSSAHHHNLPAPLRETFGRRRRRTRTLSEFGCNTVVRSYPGSLGSKPDEVVLILFLGKCFVSANSSNDVFHRWGVRAFSSHTHPAVPANQHGSCLPNA